MICYGHVEKNPNVGWSCKMSTELTVLLDGMRLAGAEILSLQKNGFSVERKANNDLLTQADLAANHILKSHLSTHFPAIGWLSEESVDDNSANIFRVKSWSTNYEMGFGIDFFSEYFIFSPSIRGVFGINDELIRDNASSSFPNAIDPNSSPYTSNIESIKNRAIFINFTFH